jgi:hypothetical protein
VLSLITVTATIDWMRKKDYLQKWLLLVNLLSTNDKDLKNYLNCPTDNSPKMMPLDCSLYKDLKDAVMQHVCYMCHLPKDEPHKFSLWLLGLPSKPGARRWLSNKDGSPRSSKQILQDIRKVFESMERIREAKGALIRGIGDRKGRRALQQHVSGINRRGGKRDRQPEKDRVHWIHLHALAAYALKLETRIALHARNKENVQSPGLDAHHGEGEGEDSL